MGTKTTNLFCLLLITAMMFGGHAAAEGTSGSGKVRLNDDYMLSGPYDCKNLSVYLIHGKAQIKDKRIISLAEAMDKGVVTIQETGAVNQLSASNNSDTEYVFIQSGDIVKGGRQDRTLAQDTLLPPKSKKAVLESFCVEQGRWHKRGNERADRFSSSDKKLSSKELKLAAKQDKSQEAVWMAVAEEQADLSDKMGKSVRKAASATSLQLSLEDKDVEKKSLEYRKVILPAGENEKDAVGFAFAVNGEFNSADIYGDPDLFRKLWPQLIETASYEAISLYDEKTAHRAVRPKEVRKQLLEALSSRKKREKSIKGTLRTVGQTSANYAFETKDEKDQTLHINVIAK